MSLILHIPEDARNARVLSLDQLHPDRLYWVKLKSTDAPLFVASSQAPPGAPGRVSVGPFPDWVTREDLQGFLQLPPVQKLAVENGPVLERPSPQQVVDTLHEYHGRSIDVHF
jgi:hypothetical protein